MLNVLLLILSFSALATSLDDRLQGYIKDFNLQPLNKPTGGNQKLWSLGRELFHERALSGNNNISCVECHHPRSMTGDGLPLALGEGARGIQTATTRRMQESGKIVARNTPALFNLNGVEVMFWDGRISMENGNLITPIPLAPEVKQVIKSALAAQAIFPIANHEEMRGQPGSNDVANAKSEKEAWEIIVKRVVSMPKYKVQFEELFPGQKINIGHVGEALAEFQRFAFFRADTAYDDYLRGNKDALSEVQKIGMDIFFGKGKCGECHNGAHLSNFEFHNVGTAQIGPGTKDGDDLGRYNIDKNEKHLYAFRVPPLRNVALTGPYMHDGIFKTIPQVIEHYDMVEESLREFKHVNNWKNYIEEILDHDHSNDDLRVATLSPKLTPKLFFEEEEEKALAEFIMTGLTDKYLLSLEIDGNYQSYLRMQLKPAGHQKLAQLFTGKKTVKTYYYFDAYLEGSYFLRGLAEPIRLFIIRENNSAKLVYREEAFKSAIANQGVVISGVFQRNEEKIVPETTMVPLETAYLDMMKRIYAYNDGNRQEPIPMMELSLIKSDLEDINQYFHNIKFEGADNISDKLNLRKDEIIYVPTSYNIKEETEFSLRVDGKKVEGLLMDSTLRTETGAVVKTYAVEFYASKMTKAELAELGKKILQQVGLVKEEVGGGSPSPSQLTLKVINQVME